jgi:signal transduction histidine kinase
MSTLAQPRSLDRTPDLQPRPEHLVQFYDDDRYLAGVVASFVAKGLTAGSPAVLISTPEHREEFCGSLEAAGFDVARSQASGLITFRDARETLATFMVSGMPDWELFRSNVGGLLQHVSAARPGAQICAYGEMVDLLWRDGNPQGAIRLEELWNDLAHTASFTLLCAYVMGNFYKESDGGDFSRICETHTHVLPTESFPADDAEARLAEVTRLQQRARALEHEVEERRKLEKELREALALRRVAEESLRNSREELRLQNEQLTRTVKFAEMFVGILGHDLRNPLCAITTAASLLARRADSDRVTRPATRILGSAARMARMIDQVLDFTRIRLGQGLPLDRKTTDLGEVCRAALDELESNRPDGPVRLETSGDLVGWWDADRLAQLISNLLGNALTHGSDPITVRADGSETRSVSVEVRNGGCIPEELLPVIFEPFRTSANRKSERSSGLGLGLYISQQVALAHEGSIDVASDAEHGTCFTIRLPRLRPQPR